MRILYIEQDEQTRKAVEIMLAHAYMNVYSAQDGEEGQDIATLYEFDIILLEIHLPDVNGIDILRKIRGTKINTPIMAITRDDSTEMKLRFFGFGGDDYLTKPFHREELVARINAIVRRSKNHSSNKLRSGDFEIDIENRTVTVNGEAIKFTRTEYKSLEIMALKKGLTVSKERMMNHLYGGMDEPDPKIIDVFICKIRTKLKKFDYHDIIETVWGEGYRMVEKQE